MKSQSSVTRIISFFAPKIVADQPLLSLTRNIFDYIIVKMRTVFYQKKFFTETIELKFPKIRWNSKIVIFVQWFISTAIPLVLLLAYQKYADEHGITLEKGCEGPGLPFGMLSGILFLLQLRFSPSEKE